MLFRSLCGTLLAILLLAGCQEETRPLRVVEGVVLGPGCRTGSFDIQVRGKNRAYGINESPTFDNVVETANLPEAYQTSGTRVFFTFTQPDRDDTSQYLTYCTPPPQINIVSIWNDWRPSVPAE